MRGILPGATVTAWYNPTNPGEAVLRRAPNPIMIAILIAIVAAGALFSWIAARLGPRRIDAR